tara:strand:+ start:127 stop:501 length:375 start_codon:yes stop_codon:yes gene_type:complete
MLRLKLRPIDYQLTGTLDIVGDYFFDCGIFSINELSLSFKIFSQTINHDIGHGAPVIYYASKVFSIDKAKKRITLMSLKTAVQSLRLIAKAPFGNQVNSSAIGIRHRTGSRALSWLKQGLRLPL